MSRSDPFTPTQRRWLGAYMVALPLLIIAVLHNQPLSGRLPPRPIAEISDIQLQTDKGPVAIELPYSRRGKKAGEILEFNMKITHSPQYSGLFWIVADDCVQSVQVGERVVELEKEILGDVCDWQNGFRLDLNHYLMEGVNNVAIQIMNAKGKAAFTIEAIAQ